MRVDMGAPHLWPAGQKGKWPRTPEFVAGVWGEGSLAKDCALTCEIWQTHLWAPSIDTIPGAGDVRLGTLESHFILGVLDFLACAHVFLQYQFWMM